MAIGLTLAMAAIKLLKGFDFEEAAFSLGAPVLWWGRDAFYVRNVPLRTRSVLGGRGGRRRGSLRRLARGLGAEQRLDELAGAPSPSGACLVAILALTGLASSGRSPRRRAPCDEERGAAAEPFAPRLGHARVLQAAPDAHYRFSGDGRAFLGTASRTA